MFKILAQILGGYEGCPINAKLRWNICAPNTKPLSSIGLSSESYLGGGVLKGRRTNVGLGNQKLGFI